jgi:acyl dehydratase
MKVRLTHALQQGPCIAMLGKVAVASLRHKGAPDLQTPGPIREAQLPPRDATLLLDYIEWTGGDIPDYHGQVPAHFFPQWGFPLLADALGDVPWPMSRILNQGCRIEHRAPLPAGEDLHCSAQLISVEETETKARITTRIITGTATVAEAIVADVHAVVPLKKKQGGSSKRTPPTVPENAIELARHELTPRSGLDFALLTGDFNPIHWIKPYAKLAGFKSTILHGFASLALSWEDMITHQFGGETSAIAAVDVRFVRPLHLPVEVGVYVSPKLNEDGHFEIALGKGPGDTAYMLGTAEPRS